MASKKIQVSEESHYEPCEELTIMIRNAIRLAERNGHNPGKIVTIGGKKFGEGVRATRCKSYCEYCGQSFYCDSHPSASNDILKGRDYAGSVLVYPCPVTIKGAIFFAKDSKASTASQQIKDMIAGKALRVYGVICPTRKSPVLLDFSW